MTTCATLTLHQGDTFSRLAIALGPDGQPIALPDDIDITVLLGTPALRRIATLSATLADQTDFPGGFLVSATDTSTWPTGELSLQVKVVIDGVVKFEDVSRVIVLGVIK